MGALSQCIAVYCVGMGANHSAGGVALVVHRSSHPFDMLATNTGHIVRVIEQ